MAITKWEKQLEKSGYAIIDFTHEEIMDHLLEIFSRDRSDLLLKAAMDDTRRHNLIFCLDHGNFSKLTTFGGTVNYSKKLRKFNYITYSDKRNFAVQFSIDSKAACFCYDHYVSFKKIFPFGASNKRTTEYLLAN